jgi:integrase
MASGRWQVRYTGPDGRRWTAPRTYTRKADAVAERARTRREIELGEWKPPTKRRRGQPREAPLTVGEFAASWLAAKDIAESTRELYERTIRLHIEPALGTVALAELDADDVAEWWASLPRGQRRMRAQSYSLLSDLCKAAVARGLLGENPCSIKGARAAPTEHEVVVATPDQVMAAVAAMPAHLAIALILGASCHLRSGELRELRRRDLDLTGAVLGHPSVHISRAVARVRGRYVVGPTKTGKARRVALPPGAVTALEAHLADHVEPGPDGLIIHKGGDASAHIVESNFAAKWRRAFGKAGLPPGFRFHDLRHTGLTWLAGAGATVRELMDAAGHSTPEMAMRYQHSAQGRAAALAAAMPLLTLAGEESKGACQGDMVS